MRQIDEHRCRLARLRIENVDEKFAKIQHGSVDASLCEAPCDCDQTLRSHAARRAAATGIQRHIEKIPV
jgi:hypothetical protein